MASSNSALNRVQSAHVEHVVEVTNLPKLKACSFEKISSPSSSADSPLDDRPFHDDDDNDMIEAPSDKSDDISVSDNSAPISQTPELLAMTEAPTNKTDDNSVSGNSIPISQPRELLATIEAPPTQEMERSPSSYRIPSYVFKRSKSSTPVEWSVASNESLFSIHTGNMSFTSQNYFWRAEDLCPPTEASTSDQMFSYPAQASAGGLADDMRSHELGLAEATMLEVIKENEVQSRETSMAEARHARHSERSNTSFAFSIVGDGASPIRIPSSVRSNQSQLPPTAQTEPLPDPKPPTNTGNEAQSSWFSCFSCCGSNQ